MHILRKLIALGASTWWRLLIVFGANALALNILFALENRFINLTGQPVFDTQNDLTAAQITEQLELYQGAAGNAYLAFAAFDFLFPLVGALSIAVLIAWLLKHNPSPSARSRLVQLLPLLPFASTLFDWLENVSLLTIIGTADAAPQLLLNAAILFKRLKLISLGTGSATVLLLLLFTGVGLFNQWRHVRTAKAAAK